MEKYSLQEIYELVGRLVVEQNHLMITHDEQIKAILMPMQNQIEKLNNRIQELEAEK